MSKAWVNFVDEHTQETKLAPEPDGTQPAAKPGLEASVSLTCRQRFAQTIFRLSVSVLSRAKSSKTHLTLHCLAGHWQTVYAAAQSAASRLWSPQSLSVTRSLLRSSMLMKIHNNAVSQAFPFCRYGITALLLPSMQSGLVVVYADSPCKVVDDISRNVWLDEVRPMMISADTVLYVMSVGLVMPCPQLSAMQALFSNISVAGCRDQRCVLNIE